LEIWSNGVLENLSGLDNLILIGGRLGVGYNDTLTNLMGLNNIDGASINNLRIVCNKLLSSCEVQSICDYLSSPNGTVEIYNNAPGCNSPEEVEEACESSCLPEGITFTTQAEIDSFPINHPNCTEIEGDVNIGAWLGSDITNLNGLNSITAIGEGLAIGWWFMGNALLSDLSGLENLTSIGGNLDIHANSVLENLTGLESLTSIGGYIMIGNGDAKSTDARNKMNGNPSLKSLTGLENLETIGGGLFTQFNNSLTSFKGLEKIDSIGGIRTSDPIASLSDLYNLTYIGNEGLNVCNTALTSFAGLENVTSITGDFIIDCNDSLIGLTGLKSMASIGGQMIIGGWCHESRGNPSLILGQY
jgi:hypothetical protein